MTLQSFLNKFDNCDFLITVSGWCDELHFSEYESEKKEDYWDEYKNRKIKSFALLTTNEIPELCIYLYD